MKTTLLVNLGSPASTSVDDVRVYLEEFLSDPRVIDIPKPIQQAVLRLFILPFRPKSSAEAYEKIWTEEGSPLIVTTYGLAEKVAEQVDTPVAVGMRYGEPSIETGIRKLLDRGATEIFLVPLYPHYAMSSYETVVAKTQDVLDEIGADVDLTVQPPFYDDPDYVDAVTETLTPHLEDPYDHVLFSYHGVPERHVRKTDPSGCYCMKMEGCCYKPHPAHAFCYRHQIIRTTELVTERAGIPPEKWSFSFQSRLGIDPWLEPFTSDVFERLPSRGVKRLVVLCPAFVADCLETIEEIGMEGRETFLEAGGKSFDLVPCLNEHPSWVDLLTRFVRDFESGTLDGTPASRTETAAE